MAQIKTEGLDELELCMKQLAELPDDVAIEMLQAGGKIVAEAQRRKYRTLLYNVKNQGKHLADSIEVSPGKLYKDGNGYYVTIYPYGKHHTYIARIRTRTYKNSKSGRTYTVGGKSKIATMNDVAFVHEYGAPQRGIAAKGIMRAANEESAPAAVDAEAKVYDAWLTKNNL